MLAFLSHFEVCVYPEKKSDKKLSIYTVDGKSPNVFAAFLQRETTFVTLFASLNNVDIPKWGVNS